MMEPVPKRLGIGDAEFSGQQCVGSDEPAPRPTIANSFRSLSPCGNQAERFQAKRFRLKFRRTMESVGQPMAVNVSPSGWRGFARTWQLGQKRILLAPLAAHDRAGSNLEAKPLAGP